MSISLNLILLLLFGVWFHKKINNSSGRLILTVVLIFLGTTVSLFIILSLIEDEYLGFIEKFVAATISLILFWIFTTVEIIVSNIKKDSRSKIFTDLLQTSILLIFPVGFYWWIISDVSLKIGG